MLTLITVNASAKVLCQSPMVEGQVVSMSIDNLSKAATSYSRRRSNRIADITPLLRIALLTALKFGPSNKAGSQYDVVKLGII